MFRETPGCDTLSTAGTIVIFCIAFVFCFAVVALLYYRYYKEQKSEILEELRQNLLAPAVLVTSGNAVTKKKSTVPQQFLEDLQQSLILKDVFVNYNDIKIDSRIGEGSFGVVFKAYFRGAQVAVKQMRSPLFEDITQHDIEEFRKEAYMMSRLRHPNIVLVMGISLVDIEASTAVSKFGREESSDSVGPGPLAKKGETRKTVCIITEYLEQGSLADILYGPTRLPPEVFTYELVLACALQAARGMLYLHSHQPPICHRDLKSSNLVVDDHWVVKVTDFGMSRIIPEKVQNKEMGIGVDRDDDTDTNRDSFRSDFGMPNAPSAHPARERSTVVNPFHASSSSMNSIGPVGKSSASVSASGPLTPQHLPGGSRMNSSFLTGDYTPTTANMSTNYETDRVSEISRSSSELNIYTGVVGKDAAGHNRYSSFHPEMTSNLGTTAWCAPELLTATSTTRYSVKVDVYSFGMVLWELWEKRRPYDELQSRFDITDAIKGGKRPHISDSCPPAFRSIMQRCWQAEPARRPTFKYIERYLKEELARVRRQKHMNNSSGGNNSSGFGSEAVSANNAATGNRPRGSSGMFTHRESSSLEKEGVRSLLLPEGPGVENPMMASAGAGMGLGIGMGMSPIMERGSSLDNYARSNPNDRNTIVTYGGPAAPGASGSGGAERSQAIPIVQNAPEGSQFLLE
jgi:serine/threonine protein kinase